MYGGIVIKKAKNGKKKELTAETTESILLLLKQCIYNMAYISKKHGEDIFFDSTMMFLCFILEVLMYVNPEDIRQELKVKIKVFIDSIPDNDVDLRIPFGDDLLEILDDIRKVTYKERPQI